MLSDACLEFTDAVFSDGVTDELYDQLLSDLETYSAESYDYPVELLSFLRDLVLAVRTGTASGVILMMALGETLRAYLTNREDLIASLGARLADMWPHRVQCVEGAGAPGQRSPSATVHFLFGADRSPN